MGSRRLFGQLVAQMLHDARAIIDVDLVGSR